MSGAGAGATGRSSSGGRGAPQVVHASVSHANLVADRWRLQHQVLAFNQRLGALYCFIVVGSCKGGDLVERGGHNPPTARLTAAHHDHVVGR